MRTFTNAAALSLVFTLTGSAALLETPVPGRFEIDDGAKVERLEGAIRVTGSEVRLSGVSAEKDGRGLSLLENGKVVRSIGVDGTVEPEGDGWRIAPHPHSPGSYVLLDFTWQEPKPVYDPSNLAMNRDRVIRFANPLPRRWSSFGPCSVNNNPEFAVPGVIAANAKDIGFFMKKLRDTVADNRRLVNVDGKWIVCNHNWIRDHTHQMKGWCHWERDCRSFIDLILDNQREDGMFYELIKQLDDSHANMVDATSRKVFEEDNYALARLDLEADVEYLTVEAVHRYWRMTGDDGWMARALPRLEKAIEWQTNDPRHFNRKHGLYVRPFTIDTWDFVPTGVTGQDRRIHPWEPLPAMHGDNTGIYQAMNQLAAMNDRLDRRDRADGWRARAAELKTNIMRELWNGRYFIHQKFFDGERGIDNFEDVRLSLSDAYALNRGILSLAERQSIVDEYQSRRKTTKAFAEWFTVDPPYVPRFGRHPAGEYVNGAISPFTAGELALGAFGCGREVYGWDILERFMRKVERDGNVYFLYNPANGESISASIGPSAWGAAALLNALDEGLAGIVNVGFGYDEIAFSPRWPVTPYTELRYITGYESVGRFVDCRHVRTEKGMRYLLKSPARRVVAHMLLPVGREAAELRINGRRAAFSVSSVGMSSYIDAETVPEGGVSDFGILFK